MSQSESFPFAKYHIIRSAVALPQSKRWQGSPWRRRYPRLRYPTPATIELPEPLGDRPPTQYAEHWQHSGLGWGRDFRALSLMAVTGWCSRLALTEWLVANDPSFGSTESGSIKRLWQRLTTREPDFAGPLVLEERVPIDPGHRFEVALVHLGISGRELVNDMGIPLTAVSELDRLDRRHHACSQPVHTAMIILAAHYFRRHGFWTQVVPVLPWPLAPDILVVDPVTERRFYVEVEAPQATGRAKALRLRRKWELQQQLQGFACLVALSPRQLAQRVRSATTIAEDGLATDLRSLSHHPETLWTTTWGRFARRNPFAGHATDQTPAMQGGGARGSLTPTRKGRVAPAWQLATKTNPAQGGDERRPITPVPVPSSPAAKPAPAVVQRPADQSRPAAAVAPRGPFAVPSDYPRTADRPTWPPPSRPQDQPGEPEAPDESRPFTSPRPPLWPRPSPRPSSW